MVRPYAFSQQLQMSLWAKHYSFININGLKINNASIVFVL